MTLLTWKKVLDVYEKQNPRGFDYFYHFHYIHGLPDYDLSPYERLEQIAEYSCEADEFTADLEQAAFFCVSSLSSGIVVFSEEGILVRSA